MLEFNSYILTQIEEDSEILVLIDEKSEIGTLFEFNSYILDAVEVETIQGIDYDIIESTLIIY